MFSHERPDNFQQIPSSSEHVPGQSESTGAEFDWAQSQTQRVMSGQHGAETTPNVATVTLGGIAVLAASATLAEGAGLAELYITGSLVPIVVTTPAFARAVHNERVRWLSRFSPTSAILLSKIVQILKTEGIYDVTRHVISDQSALIINPFVESFRRGTQLTEQEENDEARRLVEIVNDVGVEKLSRTAETAGPEELARLVQILGSRLLTKLQSLVRFDQITEIVQRLGTALIIDVAARISRAGTTRRPSEAAGPSGLPVPDRLFWERERPESYAARTMPLAEASATENNFYPHQLYSGPSDSFRFGSSQTIPGLAEPGISTAEPARRIEPGAHIVNINQFPDTAEPGPSRRMEPGTRTVDTSPDIIIIDDNDTAELAPSERKQSRESSHHQRFDTEEPGPSRRTESDTSSDLDIETLARTAVFAGSALLAEGAGLIEVIRRIELDLLVRKTREIHQATSKVMNYRNWWFRRFGRCISKELLNEILQFAETRLIVDAARCSVRRGLSRLPTIQSSTSGSGLRMRISLSEQTADAERLCAVGERAGMNLLARIALHVGSELLTRLAKLMGKGLLAKIHATARPALIAGVVQFVGGELITSVSQLLSSTKSERSTGSAAEAEKEVMNAPPERKRAKKSTTP